MDDNSGDDDTLTLVRWDDRGTQ